MSSRESTNADNGSYSFAAARAFVFWLRVALVAGSALGAFLVVLTMVRYRPSSQQTLLYWLALGLLVACGAFAFLRLRQSRPDRTIPLVQFKVLRLGVGFGLLLGSLWITEIIMGNLAGSNTPLVVAVYRGATLIAFALPGAAGATGAYELASVRAGAAVGFWSGLISGLIAFLTLMWVMYLFLPVLEHDPQTLQEYARSTERTLATFIAGDFLFGACSHLLLIGLLYGTVLATIGAALGRALAPSASPRTTSPPPTEPNL
jgi:hypothetical protein